MKRMFRVVLAFVVVAWGLTLPAMETVSAQVATIAAYSELTDANGNGTGTDGAVRVSDFHGLTNALAAAGVNCKARLNMGVAHGELDNSSVAPASVEWIVASMDQALKAGWYDVADENQDPDDPPPSDGLKMADFAKKFTVALPADFSGMLHLII